MSSGRPPHRPGARWVRRFLLVAAVAAGGLLAVVWLLGGLAPRTDYPVFAAGEEVDAGNLVFRLVEATAQARPSGDWAITVRGTVRNPHDEALAPVLGERGNLAVRPAANTVVASLESVELGGSWRRSLVPPGNRPVALAATFTLPRDARLGATLQCGVFAMEFTDNAVLGTSGGEPTWNVDSFTPPALVEVPLAVLPPAE